MPDLTITDIWRSGSQIHYLIKNIGDYKSEYSYSYLYVDGAYKGGEYSSTMSPYVSSPKYFSHYSWTCSGDSDNITVCADGSERIIESNEDNNCRTEILPCHFSCDETDSEKPFSWREFSSYDDVSKEVLLSGAYTLYYIEPQVTVLLKASDNVNGESQCCASGVDKIKYRIWKWYYNERYGKERWNLLFDWKTYSGESISLCQLGQTEGDGLCDGKYELEWYTVDNNGNSENWHLEDIYVNSTADYSGVNRVTCDQRDGCYSGTYRNYYADRKYCSWQNIVNDDDGDGYDIECDCDCDDSNPDVHPGAAEICDGLDNDCDGQVDEDLGVRSCYTGPEGTEGVGVCSAGTQVCSDGQWGICEGEILPQTEVCNDESYDNDCDGLTNCDDPDCFGDPACTECQTNDDCNYLDNDYCSGDSIMHDEGVCDNYECTVDTTTTEDCNDYDSTYCDGTLIKQDDGYCSNAQCEVDTTTVQDCDDGLWCNGQESCSNAQCVQGTPVDCSSNNINVDECFYNPDGIDYTYDYYSFTSVCDEDADQCTQPPTDWENQITHTCDVSQCGAECDSGDDCENQCIDNVFYTQGSCESECTCSYQIDNCTEHDGIVDSETQWVELDQCNEKEQIRYHYENYGCDVSDGCVVTGGGFTEWEDTGETRPKTDGTACDDGNLCTENDVCSQGVCGGSTKDCSYLNNQCQVGVCDQGDGQCYPDYTNYNGQDCDDGNACTQGDICSDGTCSGSPITCDDGNVCTNDTCDPSSGCVYTNNNDPCDDGLFCTIDDICSNGVCAGQEDRDCSDGVGCTVDSCNEQNDQCDHSPDDSYCDNFDLPPIGECGYDPDNNPYTFDEADGFDSICEPTTGCTQGSYSFTHTCDVSQCGAECESNSDCPDNTCSETYNDYCDDNRLVEYDNDKVLDSTTVEDSCSEDCGSDCTCQVCEVDCSPPSTNSYCVKDVCGAECDSGDDCESGVCLGDCTCQPPSECSITLDSYSCDYNEETGRWVVTATATWSGGDHAHISIDCDIDGPYYDSPFTRTKVLFTPGSKSVQGIVHDYDNNVLCQTPVEYVDCEGTSDSDGDGIPDSEDNCIDDPNPDQTDTDQDGLGDVCDEDDDNDGYSDIDDCDPLDSSINPDASEVCNGLDDNCNGEIDEGFADTDSDGLADCVDTDDDQDGVFDSTDNCPLISNPDQTDSDQDGIGDACDNDTDSDGDGIPDSSDNCINDYNPDQLDNDQDRIGDICDTDDDNDGIPDEEDDYPYDYDNDGFNTTEDCDDTNAEINPDATEVCNGVDDNCNEEIDENLTVPNADKQDGVCSGSKKVCSGAEGWTEPDYTSLENYEEEETRCDGLDNDCDGQVDEGCHHGGGGGGRTSVTTVCGNEKVEGTEECDDGNKDNGDGCDEYCKVEDNWECSGSPSVCTQKPYCGDGECSAGETCAGCPEDCGECTTEETNTTTTTLANTTGGEITGPTGFIIGSPADLLPALIGGLISLLIYLANFKKWIFK